MGRLEKESMHCIINKIFIIDYTFQSFTVLEIHEPQKITSHRFVQENGQRQQWLDPKRRLYRRNHQNEYVTDNLKLFCGSYKASFAEFDTSRLEMKCVADMFDKNNRGLIDWKEFIAALRPDWQEKSTPDAQIIHDEVKRLVMLCTCRQKFRVFQVGEGKYRVSFSCH